MLSTFVKKHKLPESFELTAEQHYKPLADIIFSHFSKSNDTFFVAVNGCQGSGKSTLTDYVSEYLSNQHQLNVVVMSLDDFYYSSQKRRQLAQDIHPLLATRGVPGTHDITSLDRIITLLKQRETSFMIPKFNKATDEPYLESKWTLIDKPIDIVLLEGWCWGVMPQTAEQLKTPINDLEKQQDSSGIWRNYVNQQLADHYVPLYKSMNFWLILKAPSFDCVYQWRLEQEQKLKSKNTDLSDSKIMSGKEISNFIQHFQRLTMQELNTISSAKHTTLYLDSYRNIIKATNTGKHG
jgi:D-glycerate 3-kinase